MTNSNLIKPHSYSQPFCDLIFLRHIHTCSLSEMNGTPSRASLRAKNSSPSSTAAASWFPSQETSSPRQPHLLPLTLPQIPAALWGTPGFRRPGARPQLSSVDQSPVGSNHHPGGVRLFNDQVAGAGAGFRPDVPPCVARPPLELGDRVVWFRVITPARSGGW